MMEALAGLSVERFAAFLTLPIYPAGVPALAPVVARGMTCVPLSPCLGNAMGGAS